MTRSLVLAAPSLALALALSGCDGEGINPAPHASASTKETVTPVPPGTAKPVKRRVDTRNPLGGPPGNLLVDGDFEVSISFEGSGEQLPWLAIAPSGGQAYLFGETGGLCKSGLRCGLLEPGIWLYGKGAAADGVGMVASVWIKPPPERLCNVATVELIHCAFTGFEKTLVPVAPEPDAEGWCELRTTVSAQSSAVCMLVANDLARGETALIDRAVVLPADGSAPMSSMRPMSSARRAQVQRVSDWVRKRMPFGDPPSREPDIGPR
jgi:hypothetical protein